VILLDTQAALWSITNNALLGRRSRRIISQALSNDVLAISAVSFWEIAILIAKKRLRALKSASEQREKILAAGIQEIPLTGDVALLAVELQNLHNDPADRFILATAIVHEATLVTADTALLEWPSKLRRHNAEI
jgi:PIN domain nuclease of toxin-antitoxin system